MRIVILFVMLLGWHPSALAEQRGPVSPVAEDRGAHEEPAATREEIEANFKRDLDYWREVIGTYARDVSTRTGETVRNETRGLRAAWDAARVRLDDLRSVASENWEVARDRFEAAYNDLENAWAGMADGTGTEEAKRPSDLRR